MNKVHKTENSVNLDEQQQSTQIDPSVNTAHKYKKVATLVAAAGIALLLVVLLLVTASKSDDPLRVDQAEADNTKQLDQQSVASNSLIPASLLQKNQAQVGYSIGYILADSRDASASWLFKTAHAETEDYVPHIFYRKAVDGVLQIFAHNVVDKTETQLTDEELDTKNPIFNSPKQILAYNTEFSKNTTAAASDCSLIIRNLTDETAITVTDETLDNVCDTPESISPQGEYVLYSRTYTGIENFDKTAELYLYSIDDNSSKLVVPPAGTNSFWSETPIEWLDKNTFVSEFLKHTPNGGNLENRGFYSATVDSLDVQPYIRPLIEGANPSYNVIQSSDLYSLITDSKQIIKAPLADLEATTVFATDEPVNSFLIRLDSSENVQEVLYFAGDANGGPGGATLYGVQEGQDSQKYVSNTSYGAYFLGWGLDFNQLIYMNTVSGATEIYSYDLTTGLKELIVGDLPLMQ